jgi:hypothetical protein
MDKRLVQMGDRRDLYARFDLPARKGFLCKGAAGSWINTSETLNADCR